MNHVLNRLRCVFIANDKAPALKPITQHQLLNQHPRAVGKKQQKLTGRRKRGKAVKK